MESAPLRTRPWLTLAAFLAPIAWFVLQLRLFWTLDEQYAYGWAVPPMAAFLFWSRWRNRPPAGAAPRGVFVGLGLFAALLPPLRLLLEAAPDWSVLNWLWGLVLTAVLLGLTAAVGGRPWLVWFAAPILFLLTAVPWPQRFELALTGGLMRGVAAATAEILGAFGLAAWSSGHLLHLAAGPLGVDEACSGIRSLQAELMVTVFLGELCRLTPARRLFLMGAGFLLALAANLLRTIVLASIAARSGLESMNEWHDPVGLAVLLLALLGVWRIALVLQAKLGAPGANPSSLTHPARRLPASVALAVLSWLGLTEVAVQGWYLAHQTAPRAWAWSIRWPRGRENFHPLETPPRARHLLLCDRAEGAAWEEEGRRWLAYWLRWEPGRVAAHTVRMHEPSVCVQAGGAVLQQDLGWTSFQCGPLALAFHAYLFRQDERPMYVFFRLEEQGKEEGLGREASDAQSQPELAWTPAQCLDQAMQGRRNAGQQSIEFALLGYDSAVQAERALQVRLGDLIVSPDREPLWLTARH